MKHLNINWKHAIIWIISIIAFLIVYGIGYTILNNYEIHKSQHVQQIRMLNRISKHPTMYGYTYSVPAHNFTEKMYQLDESLPYNERVTPSLVIGQAALESNWGHSSLYKKDHNPFGIKGNYDGSSVKVSTKEYIHTHKKAKPVDMKAHFKKYPNLRDAIADHNQMLNDEFLHGDIHDTYVSEAKQLQQNGYATDPNYAQDIMQYVEKNDLTRFD